MPNSLSPVSKNRRHRLLISAGLLLIRVHSCRLRQAVICSSQLKLCSAPRKTKRPSARISTLPFQRQLIIQLVRSLWKPNFKTVSVNMFHTELQALSFPNFGAEFTLRSVDVFDNMFVLIHIERMSISSSNSQNCLVSDSCSSCGTSVQILRRSRLHFGRIRGFCTFRGLFSFSVVFMTSVFCDTIYD
jgi:hypothetical protein